MAIRNWDIVRDEFISAIANHVQGGCAEYPMEDYWLVDNGVMTQEEFDEYEERLCFYFDMDWFQCSACGWTLPIGDMADNDNWECTDCESD